MSKSYIARPVRYKLVANPVENDRDVERLRVMRNATTDGFANFNGIITKEQQQQWWQTMRTHIKAWLYFEVNQRTDDREMVGFGMLREEDGCWYNSIGVLAEQRGKGYGKQITHDLILQHNAPVYAVIRRDNVASLKMHVAQDWQEIVGNEPERLVYLKSLR